MIFTDQTKIDIMHKCRDFEEKVELMRQSREESS